jgi:hypothetical protein
MVDDIAPRPPAPAAVVGWLLTGANEQDVLEALRAKERGQKRDVQVRRRLGLPD